MPHKPRVISLYKLPLVSRTEESPEHRRRNKQYLIYHFLGLSLVYAPRPPALFTSSSPHYTVVLPLARFARSWPNPNPSTANTLLAPLSSSVYSVDLTPRSLRLLGANPVQPGLQEGMQIDHTLLAI